MAVEAPSPLELSLRDYGQILRRRKGAVAGITIFVAITTVLVSLWHRPRPVYEAVTEVRFQRNVPALDFIAQVLSPGWQDTTGSQVEEIRSIPVMEQVARALSIPLPPGAADPKEEEGRKRERLRTLYALQGQVRAARKEDKNILQIFARDADPERAIRLANAVAEAYGQKNKSDLSGQIEKEKEAAADFRGKAEEDLSAAEAAIQAFRAKWQIVSISDEVGAKLKSLADVEVRLEGIDRDIEGYRGLRKDLEGQKALATTSLDPLSGLAQLNKYLLDLMRERDNILRWATERHPRVIELDTQVKNLRDQIGKDIERRVSQLESQKGILEARVQSLKKEYGEYPDRMLAFARLERRADNARTRFEKMDDFYRQALLRMSALPTEVQILQPAVSAAVVNPATTGVHAALGALFGLLLGVLWALVRESMDTSMGTIEEVENFLGLPILGVIPDTAAEGKDAAPGAAIPPGVDPRLATRLESLLRPDSTLAEAFRSLRNHLLLALQGAVPKALQCTSATLREGKTAGAANLALAFAQGGKRVLLVDADFRRPAVHTTFGLPRTPGFFEILAGRGTLVGCRRTVSDVMLGKLGPEVIISRPWMDRLHFLPAGGSTSTLGEVLGGTAFARFLEEARGQYDLVLFDAPPVLAVADAVILGTQLDGTLLIYQVGKTPRMALRRAKMILDRAKAPMLGLVLNRVRREITPDYYSYYPPYRQDPETEQASA